MISLTNEDKRYIVSKKSGYTCNKGFSADNDNKKIP